MPKLSGLFDSFDNLDQLEVNRVGAWLKNPPAVTQLENYIANKILYPQVLPLTEFEMKIDLAILREVLRISGPQSVQKEGPLLGNNPFLNVTLRKIIIPEKFLSFVPDLATLTWVFIDGLLQNRRKKDFFEDLWTVIVADDTDEVVGSVILPEFGNKSDVLNLNLLGRSYKIKAGSLSVVVCQKDRCEISYTLDKGRLLGKKESALEVYGGRLGIMVDGRIV